MATTDTVESLPKEKEPQTPTGSLDEEKQSLKDVKIGILPVNGEEVASFNPGDVYENVRPIDLGEDGKERAIGEYSS
jgi:hypothetical protein